jgi:hypothetical protein
MENLDNKTGDLPPKHGGLKAVKNKSGSPTYVGAARGDPDITRGGDLNISRQKTFGQGQGGVTHLRGRYAGRPTLNEI